MDTNESKSLFESYINGELLSGEVKQMFSDKLTSFIGEFQNNVEELDESHIENSILKNNN